MTVTLEQRSDRFDFQDEEGAETAWLLGLWHHDELVRTEDGWRIARRHEERCDALAG